MQSFAIRTRLFLAALIVAAVPVAAFSFQPPAGAGPKAGASEAASTASPEGTFEGYPITEFMNVSLLEGANIERGHDVFSRLGNCISCHGWNGDGMGKNPRSEGAAAKLRESQLDTQGFMDIIRCGIPGTPMPFHDSQAYKNPDVCFGQVMADFDAGQTPRKGKTFRQPDLVNLVAYIQTHVQGAGETTLEQCQDFFGDSASKTCTNLE